MDSISIVCLVWERPKRGVWQNACKHCKGCNRKLLYPSFCCNDTETGYRVGTPYRGEQIIRYSNIILILGAEYYRVSQKNWVFPNWAFGDPASRWEEILMIFVTNLEMLDLEKLSFFRHPVVFVFVFGWLLKLNIIGIRIRAILSNQILFVFVLG